MFNVQCAVSVFCSVLCCTVLYCTVLFCSPFISISIFPLSLPLCVDQVARVLAEGIRSVETILQDSFCPTDDVTDSDRNAESSNPNPNRNGESLRSVWKVLGDLCSFARNIGPADVAQFIAPKDSDKNVPKDYECVTLSGLGTGDSLSSYLPLFQLLEKGENAYRKILKIAEDSGSVDSTCLFDVGCSLYFRAVVIQQSLGQGSGVFPPSDSSSGSSQDLLNQAKEFFVRGDLLR
jgi:hypothetical protein